jgi:hypothetical protein
MSEQNRDGPGKSILKSPGEKKDRPRAKLNFSEESIQRHEKKDYKQFHEKRDGKKVIISNDREFKPTDKKISQGEKRERNERRDSDEENSGDDSDEESRARLRTQAEKSRRKKRKIMANVEDDSDSDSGGAYQGEGGPDEDVFEDEYKQGITLEAFNLKEEFRDGVIDLSSRSISTKNAKEEEEDEDWLKEYDSNMRNDEYVTKLEKMRGKWAEESANFDDDSTAVSHADSLKLLEQAADLLYWGETVGKALNRLRPKTQPRVEHKKHHMNVEPEKKGEKTENNGDGKESTPFELLTSCADKLVSSESMMDVYSMTKEDLFDKLESLKTKYLRWEYKWPNQGKGGQTYIGTNEEMKRWVEDGYFSMDAEKRILVRKIVEGVPTTDQFQPLEENMF